MIHVRDRSLAALAVMAASIGCIEPSSAVCSDGRICPPGSRCDVAHNRCVEHGQDLPCAMSSEGDGCQFRGLAGGCRAGVCEPFRCGDGYVNGSEDCDGAELRGKTCKDWNHYGEAELVCMPDCKFDLSVCEGTCGDGAINGPEQCDGALFGGADCRSQGFYDGPGLACSPDTCLFDVRGCTGLCGDRSVNGTEACDGAPPKDRSCLDEGFERGLLGCSALCAPDSERCTNLGWNLIAKASPENAALKAIWGTGSNDWFAVGADTILRGSGATWNRMPLNLGESISLEGVWGSNSSDVFAVGSCESCDAARRGAVLHWDGVTWSAMALDPVDAAQRFSYVWGSGPKDVFVVAEAALLHWDGSTWTRDSPNMSVRSLWGSGPKDVFAAGSVGTEGEGVVSHFDGERWSESSPRFPFGPFEHIAGSGPADVFAVGPHRIRGTSFMMHFDGRVWSPFSLVEPADVRAVWSNGAGELFVSNAGMIQHWDGTRWLDAPLRISAAFVDIWGAPGDAFAVGNLGTIARWDGAIWSPLSSGATAKRLTVVWASGPNDAYAIEGREASVIPFITGKLTHWDGASWTPVSFDGNPGVYAAWGRGPSDVFAVGEGGMIQHWNGSRWSAMSSGTTSALTGVWGSGPRDVFAIASTGLVLRWDGSKWTSINQPASLVVDGAWGNGPDDIYAIDSQQDAISVVHWDGAAWARAPLESGFWRGVWGTGRSDVYAVGSAGTIAHWDGTTWSTVTVGSRDLRAVSGSSARDVFVVAERENALLHLRAGAWEPIALPAGAAARGLWVTPRHVFTGTGTGGLRLDRRSISCVEPERNCSNGWDDDCDGFGDDTDPDCAGRVAEVCANTADDDGDGKVDCDDLDCAAFRACLR